MGLSNLIGILNQYRDASPGSPPPNVERDFSQVAESAPQANLATGLAEAFRSNETPPFGQMLSTLFSNSNTDQRAGILNQVLGSVGPSMLSGPLAGLAASLLGGGRPTVTPEQADQISPDAVKQARGTRRETKSIYH